MKRRSPRKLDTDEKWLFVLALTISLLLSALVVIVFRPIEAAYSRLSAPEEIVTTPRRLAAFDMDEELADLLFRDPVPLGRIAVAAASPARAVFKPATGPPTNLLAQLRSVPRADVGEQTLAATRAPQNLLPPVFAQPAAGTPRIATADSGARGGTQESPKTVSL